MGDRTAVQLIVPQVLENAVRKVLEDADGFDDEVSNNFAGSPMPFTVFYLDEVNYADLTAEDRLVELKIPYDKEWEPGGNYGSGNLYVRYKDDEPIVTEVYDEDINPSLDALMEILAKNDPDSEEEVCRLTLYQELETLILNHHQRVTPLTWASQKDHIKQLATKLLIAPP